MILCRLSLGQHSSIRSLFKEVYARARTSHDKDGPQKTRAPRPELKESPKLRYIDRRTPWYDHRCPCFFTPILLLRFIEDV